MVRGGFCLRKKPLDDLASGYSNSDFAQAVAGEAPVSFLEKEGVRAFFLPPANQITLTGQQYPPVVGMLKVEPSP